MRKCVCVCLCVSKCLCECVCEKERVSGCWRENTPGPKTSFVKNYEENVAEGAFKHTILDCLLIAMTNNRLPINIKR